MARGQKTRMCAAGADGKKTQRCDADRRALRRHRVYSPHLSQRCEGLARVTSRIVAALQAIMSPRCDPAVLSHTPTIPPQPSYCLSIDTLAKGPNAPCAGHVDDLWHRAGWGESPGSQISKMAGCQKAAVGESRSASLSNACWISN